MSRKVCVLNTYFVSSYLFPERDVNHCVVQLTTDYFAFLGLTFDGSVIPKCSPRNRFRPVNDPITYTSASEDFKFMLDKIGEPTEGYSEHSMRRGGATAAARRGAYLEQICVAGHWTSVRVAAMYVENQAGDAQQFAEFLH